MSSIDRRTYSRPSCSDRVRLDPHGAHRRLGLDRVGEEVDERLTHEVLVRHEVAGLRRDLDVPRHLLHLRAAERQPRELDRTLDDHADVDGPGSRRRRTPEVEEVLDDAVEAIRLLLENAHEERRLARLRRQELAELTGDVEHHAQRIPDLVRDQDGELAEAREALLSERARSGSARALRSSLRRSSLSRASLRARSFSST